MISRRFLAAPALAIIVLAGCSREAPEAKAPESAETPSPSVSSQAPSQIDAAIPPGDINVTYTMASGPNYDPATDTVSYQVTVKNDGRAGLVSAGSDPVNFGVVVWDANRSLKDPPANQDFMRLSLPKGLAPGEELTLPVSFAVEPTIGGVVVFDGVQENVGWFSSYGKPVLTLGQFSRCNDAPKTLCSPDGSQIASN